MTKAAREIHTNFERRHAVVWVCDIQGSSAALNNTESAEYAKEFLKRFFWLSAVLVRLSGGFMAKWTGDGFLAAYEVPLERNLARLAVRPVEAAFHLSFLVNVTQLGVKGRPGSFFRFPRKFRLRHGIAYEPDALVVDHASPGERSTDIIGRGVVLAFRLSGIPAPFPGIVAQRVIVESAREAGTRQTFKRLRLRSDDILKYFKGEQWSTSALYATCEPSAKVKQLPSVLRRAHAAVQEARDPTALSRNSPTDWIPDFLSALRDGPPEWAPRVEQELTIFVQEQLLAPLEVFVRVQSDAASTRHRT